MKAAHVIPLPGAATARVMQKNGAGRHPKSITNMRHARYRLAAEKHQRQVIESEIKSVRSCIVTLKNSVALFEENLRLLTDPNMSKDERLELVARIEYDRLPWQEKERIKALRRGQGQVVSISST